MDKYPVEELDEDEDDGTIVNNVIDLEEAVIGHRIVKVEEKRYKTEITLDNGTIVQLADTSDCCAGTELADFLLHADHIDHIITGIGTTDKYTKWHIYADMGDVLELTVNWSCGNPFYYGYGFEIEVRPA